MKSLRHTKFRAFLSFILALMLCISTPLSASAVYADPNTSIPTEEIIIVGSGEVILGGASNGDVSVNAVNPLSHLALRWTSTGDGFEISMQNVGNTAIEYISGAITIYETGLSNSYNMPTLYPQQVSTVNVPLPMLQCDENIIFTVTSIDSETPFVFSFDGFRTIPAYLLAVWSPADRGTSKANLNHHFGKHRYDVLATDIVDYAQKAQAYHAMVIIDLAMMDPAQLLSNYRITISAEPTPGKKYKHIITQQFAILADVDNRIISYGI